VVWYLGLICLVSVYLSSSWSFGIRVDSTLLLISVLLLSSALGFLVGSVFGVRSALVFLGILCC
jgi:hypothetical protein